MSDIYAIIRDSMVTNIIICDGSSSYEYELVKITDKFVDIGWLYSNGEFKVTTQTLS